MGLAPCRLEPSACDIVLGPIDGLRFASAPSVAGRIFLRLAAISVGGGGDLKDFGGGGGDKGVE